jgi:hypothetical protein
LIVQDSVEEEPEVIVVGLAVNVRLGATLGELGGVGVGLGVGLGVGDGLGLGLGVGLGDVLGDGLVDGEVLGVDDGDDEGEALRLGDSEKLFWELAAVTLAANAGSTDTETSTVVGPLAFVQVNV